MRYVRSIIMVLFVLFSFTAGSVADESALSPEMLKKFARTVKLNPRDRAIYNAVTKNSINDLSVNREILRKHEAHYSDKIDTKGVTNQKSTGRCWLFAGLNVLRFEAAQKHELSGFELSQSYLSFHDKLEKANKFYEYIIEFRDRDLRDRELDFMLTDPIPDGGYWENVVDLVEKYGCVPKDIFPETQSSENTGLMNKILKRKLRSDAVQLRQLHQAGRDLKKLRQLKERMLRDVYRLLVINFGTPPTEFQWRYKDKDGNLTAYQTWTPQQFNRDFIGIDLNDYLNLFDDTIHPYNRHYIVKLSRNLYDGDDIRYVNVGLKAIKTAAIKSLQAGEPVWFAADVGYDQYSKDGIMAQDIYDYETLFNINIRLTKAQRALYRESTRNHAMVFTGVDLAQDKPVKWLVENSWGSGVGKDGFWSMYDNWFDEHVYDIVVHKKYVPENIQKLYEQDPVILPVWDPMLQAVN